MDHKDHVEATEKLVKKKMKKLMKKLHKKIDSTSQTVGGRAHRSDFSHDPRLQAMDHLAKNPEKWFLKLIKNRDVKVITQLHQIQDAGSLYVKPGDIVNGHPLTQEMIDKAKIAVEGMKKGKKPDLRSFRWTQKAGPKMAKSIPKGVKGPLGQSLKSALSLKNLYKAFKGGALFGAIFSSVITIPKNYYYVVIRKKKTLKHALGNIAKDISDGGISGGVSSVVGYATAEGLALIITTTATGGTALVAVAVVAASGAAGYATHKAVTKVWEYIPIKS